MSEGLRGPWLHPTVSTRYFIAEGYRPPGEPGVDWDPQRLPGGLRSSFTYLAWGSCFRQLQAAFPTKRINEFTEADLVKFLNEGTDRSGKRWSPNTIASRRTALTALFGWSHWQGLVRVDPAQHLRRRVRVKRTTVKQHIWLSAEEVDRLVPAADLSTSVGLRDSVLVLLLVTTGLRVTEASRLTWRQVLLPSRSIDVTAAMAKGEKQSTVPIRPAGDAREVAGGLRGGGRIPGGRARPGALQRPAGARRARPNTTWGTSLHAAAIRQTVTRLGTQIGRPALQPHDLRRTYAGLLEANGMTLRQISKLLRHSNVAVTERYLEGNPFRNNEEADRDVF